MVRYVYRQKRYKEFHIACFYSLAFCITSLRISGHALVLLMNLSDAYYHKFVYQAWVVAYFARQLENILAVQ